MAPAAESAMFVRRPKSPSSSSSSLPLIGSLRISDSGGGGGDRISRLTDDLLSKIVVHLPFKDAARTALLSTRWRHVWASTPLVLDDADLLPDLPDGRHIITDAVSSVLAAHQGPFRFVRLIHSCIYAAAHNDGGALVKSWLGVLADKGVQELVLFNPPPGATLPDVVLRISSVHRLDLGNWDFPSTQILRRDADLFPNLLELGLWHTNIGADDIDRILRYSPLLEKLALVYSDNTPPSVLIRSCSILCLLFWKSVAHEIHVLAAPSLKRLILRSKWSDALLGDDFRTRLIIGSTQELEELGYLDARIYELHIFETVIQADTVPNRYTVVPSVKVLALKVRLGVPNEANMVPSYLRCFPNVEILHVMFDQTVDGDLNFELWEKAGPIMCLRSKIKKLVLKNFQGNYNELAFFMFVEERAEVLQKIVVVLDDHTSRTEMIDKIKSLVSAKRAYKGRKPMIMVQSGGSSWNFHIASDLSMSDPFVGHSFLNL